MAYEINYSLYLFALVMAVWVVGYPIALLYELFNGKFRPLYMLAWPFLVLFELLG